MQREREEESVAIATTSVELSNKQRSQSVMLEEAISWVKSGLLPASIKTPEQAVVIALKGRELNLQTMASFEMIDVIMGKPCLKPELLGL